MEAVQRYDFVEVYLSSDKNTPIQAIMNQQQTQTQISYDAGSTSSPAPYYFNLTIS